MRRRFNALLFVVVAMGCATPARIPRNRYGLEVVPDLATYERLARIDPDKKLVDVQQFVPGLVTDVRYATSDNFMHQELYPLAVVFLRRPAAEALRDVQSDLATRGLGLEVFDGYRPYRVTERMWEPIRNPDFVADPAKGSRHNRGAAVDLTIVVEYGESIPKVAQQIRENVIRRIEGTTGLAVTEVNVTVNDLHFPGDEEPDEAARVQ